MKQKQQLKSIILTYGSLLLIALADIVFFLITDKGIPCIFRLITGWKCPGCGMTHAVAALLHGNLRQALEYNSLCLSVIPVLLVYLLFRLIRTIRTGFEGFQIWEYVLLFSLSFATIGYGIIRNIS